MSTQPVEFQAFTFTDSVDFVESQLSSLVFNIQPDESDKINLLSNSLIKLEPAHKFDDIIFQTLLQSLTNPQVRVRLVSLSVLKGFIYPFPYKNPLFEQYIDTFLSYQSTETDPTVQTKFIELLGTFAMEVQNEETSTRICDRFRQMIDTNMHDYTVLFQILACFRSITCHVSSKFREDLILPSLMKIATHNNLSNHPNKGEMVQVLFQGIRSFQGCRITPNAIENMFLPILQILIKDHNLISDEKVQNKLKQMLTDIERIVLPPSPAKKTNLRQGLINLLVKGNMSEKANEHIRKILAEMEQDSQN